MNMTTKFYPVMYIYTTPLNRKEGRVKFGSTRRKAGSALTAAEIRIKEQVTAAHSADPYEILHVEDVSDICPSKIKNKNLSELRRLEQTWCHTRLKKEGLWVPSDNKASEWFFDPSGNVDTIKDRCLSLINEKRYGVPRPDHYPMRMEQQLCHDKAIVHFNSVGDKFLVNAKMRYGKTFVGYQIAKTLNAKRVLIITYKPAVMDGWRADCEQHVDFDGFDFYAAAEFDKNNPIRMKTNNKTDILFTSFQDFNDFEKRKWKIAKKYHFDLVIVDEMHYGTKTERALRSMKQLSYDRVLYMSGTPIKALLSGEFLEEEMYTWSYADEQRKRQAEKNLNWKTEIYRWLPVMQFHTFEVCKEAKELQATLYDDDEAFSMTKMFGSDDGLTFNDEPSVSLFLDQLAGSNTRKTKSPYRSMLVDHALWVLPSNIKSVNAMVAMLQKHRFFQDFEIINVAGDNVTKLNEVKTKIIIAKFAKKKTITVTCGRFNTGVTVPEWDAVFMLDDGASPETYFQSIFRCQNPDQSRGKEKCFVIDFNPQRCMNMIYEYADIVAKKNEDTETSVREFLEFAPVLDHTDNKPKEIDAAAILQFMAETGGYAERFSSMSMYNWHELDNVRDMFEDVTAEKQAVIQKQIANNELEKGKNFTSSNKKGKGKAISGLTKIELNAIRLKIQTVFRRLPTLLFIAKKPIKGVNDVIKMNKQNIDDFEDIIGISYKEFVTIFDTGFVKTDRLNRCIIAYNRAEMIN